MTTGEGKLIGYDYLIVAPGLQIDWDRYHHAVAWLARVQQAYKRMGRLDEWAAYLAGLREKHGRKYKLMGLMKEQF